MDVKEYQRHAAAQDLLRIISDLRIADRSLLRAIERIKPFGQTNKETNAIEENIDAIREGIIETIRMAAQTRESIRSQMLEPDATPTKNLGGQWLNATPFQRMLIKEGVKLDILKYEPRKRELRAPRIIPFNLASKTHKRRKGKDHLSL